MINLFKSEWARIKRLALLAALIHAIVLLFMLNFGLLFSHSVGFNITWVLMYGGAALLFAVLQLRLYKEAGQWVYLLNRPLSAKRVFLALLLAAVTLFTVSLLLPLLVVTWGMDRYSNTQIDWRHYLQLFYLLGVAISFYLAGVLLTLTRSKWYGLLLILPILPLMSINLGGQVFVLLAVVLLTLLLMVLLFFRINLHRQPQGAPWLVLAVVVQWCVFMALSASLDVVQLTVAEMAYLHEADNEQPTHAAANQFRQVTYLDAKQKIINGLSDASQFDPYQQQLELNEAFRIRKRVWFHPDRQQIPLMDERPLLLDAEDSEIQWVFSHDDMLFVGQYKDDLQAAGYLGPNKRSEQLVDFSTQDRFQAVPWIAGQQFIVGHQLFRYEPVTATVNTLFTAAADEYLLNVLQRQGDINSLITNRQLYLFDAIETQKQQWPLQAFLVMPLPGDYNNLWDISVMQLKDHFLLSFLYGKDPRKVAYPAAQLTYRFGFNGDYQAVASRGLQHDEGPIMRYADFILAPVWAWVADRWPPLPARDRYLSERPWPSQIPMVVLGLWAVLAMIICWLGWRIARRRQLSGPQSWLWLISLLFTGIPGLVALLLLSEQADVLTADQRAAALDHAAMGVGHV